MVYQTFTTSLYSYERPIGALNVGGYVVLSTGSNAPQVYAHRLIWAVGTGQMPDPPLVVNHINGVKRDNRLCNLELISQGANIQHAYDTGLTPSGEQHYSARLSDADVLRIYALQFSEGSATDVAARFGITQSYVNHIWGGRMRARKLVA
jgi:hypothetical protein